MGKTYRGKRNRHKTYGWKVQIATDRHCCKHGTYCIIQIGQIFLVVCENTFNHLDPNSYKALNLEPENARIVGVKSTQHFRAFYGSIAKGIYLLDMPGPSSSEFKRFNWEHISRPMWPLDEIEDDFTI